MSAIRTILCPVDFSPLSHRSLRLAIEMCRRIKGRLVLHHNMGPRPPGYLSVSWMWSEDHEAAEEAKATEVPQQLEELFSEIPDTLEYEARVTRGPLDVVLPLLARQIPADLIVMGTHGRSTGAHKSLTERIIIRSPCTVLTTGEGYDPDSIFGVEGGEPAERRSVLVPVDFTRQSRAALNFALGLAQAMPHQLTLLHVLKGVGTVDAAELRVEVERTQQQQQALVPASLRERTRTEVAVGQPAEQILRVARETDALFILMAAQGKSPVKRFLFGATTLEVLHGSDCPVWFVPAQVRKAVSKIAVEALD